MTPRGIKPEATKNRAITMGNMPLGNTVNDGIPKADHLEMARLQDIDHHIKECYARSGACWMAKAESRQHIEPSQCAQKTGSCRGSSGKANIT